MNKVICLKTGDQMICHIEDEVDLSQRDQALIVYNPMYIVQTMSEYSVIGFKLEDALLFSSNDSMTLQHKDVVTIYD
ncbi:hypothetical protein M3M33_13665, partial [Loigolactobacillus coryniformis]|uniref:hypothetical protein n=1 Tax=Loigolactobacillus coryniformis TaxID=1610 RepID=UPI00201A93B7